MPRETYIMKAPVPTDPTQANSASAWHRIGRATKLDGERIICTMESIPLNWNGVFYLFSEEKK